MGDVFGHDLPLSDGLVLRCDGCEDPDSQSVDQQVTLAEYMIEITRHAGLLLSRRA